MSASSPNRPILPADIKSRKGGDPLVVLTAYTTPMARIVDRHCDIALVGDSLGMVLHGLPSTIGVTMEMMILHGRAVVRGLQKAMAVIDMPFGSYEESPEQAFRNAARLMADTGAPCVKLEGGQHMAETIAFLTSRGVPVMAHIGLTPQSVNTLGGYKVVGRDEEAAKVMADAEAIEAAGAFSVVLEKVPEGLAGRISQRLAIPTIGIGAGVHCDGQVLVVDDMLGLFTDFRPKFVKRYGELGPAADRAIADYAAEVRSRAFPGAEHSFPDVLPAKGAEKLMQILRTVAELRTRVRGWKKDGLQVGVVPTMGALHDGHMSLVRAAKRGCDRVIVTIFVNPMQFNNPDDLTKYPRTEATDAGLLVNEGVDILFAPAPDEVYPEGFASRVLISGVTAPLEGEKRPGHFEGVATVVAKLFGMTCADRAYFGQKDWQQVQVVKRLVADLNIPVEVVGCETIREADGLAMSSRNLRLDPLSRAQAPALYRIMGKVAAQIRAGADVAASLAQGIDELRQAGFSEIEYLELRTAAMLDPATALDQPCRLLAAASIGGVRLIDNIPV